ncbi:MAG: regulatory protein RecX [Coriobacteriia bacterium]|nr:regulatory protein RecX [Coriobacteriia bacterium]
MDTGLVCKLRIELADQKTRTMGAPFKQGSLYFEYAGQEEKKLLPHVLLKTLDISRLENLSYAEFSSQLTCEIKKSAWKRIIESIEKKDRSTKEVYGKLSSEGFPEDTVDEFIALAQNKKLLDDLRFAESFIRSKKIKGWGRKKIEYELRLRGINASELENYPHAFFNPDEEVEIAYTLLSKKSLPDKNAYQKFYRLLAAKGFSSDVISTAISLRLNEE